MKILHTADWHLGKRLFDISRLDEQKTILDEICQIAEREDVDAVLIAGDLFDNANPSSEATELLYRAVHRLAKNGTRPVIAIAGNHDSADRIEVPDPLARACGIFFTGYPQSQIPVTQLDTGLEITQSASGFLEIKLPNYSYPLRILATPYANESRLRQFLGTEDPETVLQQILAEKWDELANIYCNENGVNLLMAHLFLMAENGEQPKESEDERSILHVGGAQVVLSKNIPEKIQYTALGHLHRFHYVPHPQERPVAYSGSLLEYSFSEANQQKYVLLVEVEPAQPAKVTPLPLSSGKKLHRKRFFAVEEAKQWLEENPDCFVEMTLVSDTYLEGSVKKDLFQLHSGLVALIPEFRGDKNTEETDRLGVDLTRSREELFGDYFMAKNGGQAPSEELLSLFREIVGKERE